MLGLNFRQFKGLRELFPGFSRILAGADDVNDIIDRIQGDEQTLNDVRSVSGLLTAILATTPDHIEAVLDVDLQHFLQSQGARATFDQSHVIYREGIFHGGELVELL